MVRASNLGNLSCKFRDSSSISTAVSPQSLMRKRFSSRSDAERRNEAPRSGGGDQRGVSTNLRESKCVGTDDLAPLGGADGHPGDDVDRVLEELDATVAHRGVHPAGVLAPRS